MLTQFGRISELVLAIFVVSITALLLIPLQPWLLDILLSVNLCSALLLLLVGLYTPNPLKLLAFPALLLLSTLFRLSLNVASTRLILSRGDAGQVIQTFGTFLISGEVVVGVILFLIITVVNFTVIARGASRVSEVSARFALDALPDIPAAPRGAPFLRGDMHCSTSLAELERAYDDWKEGRWSAEPYFDMLIPSQIDPTMAPKGKHMMTVFVQYAPYDLEMNGVRSADNWNDDTRKAFADSVFDKIAQAMPDIRDRVVHAEIRSPWDIENEVGLTEGNIFQGELTFDQLLFNRPVPGYAQYRTPIAGLYLAGSSAHPGGGVMAAPGANAAREILRGLGKAGRMPDHAA